MSGRRRILLVVGAAVLLAACGGTSRTDFDEEIQSRGGGLGSTLAIEALDALEAELGDDIVLRSFTMTNGQVSMEVRVHGTTDQVVDSAIETADLEGGYAQTLRVDRSTDRTMIAVNVTSPRESVQVRFRADGTPVRTGDG